eukprot:1183324-Rhodomonas_salina.3
MNRHDDAVVVMRGDWRASCRAVWRESVPNVAAGLILSAGQAARSAPLRQIESHGFLDRNHGTPTSARVAG